MTKKIWILLFSLIMVVITVWCSSENSMQNNNTVLEETTTIPNSDIQDNWVQDKPIDNTNTSIVSDAMKQYNNKNYHFSMMIPKIIYSHCKQDQEVIVQEKENTIHIGVINNCPEMESWSFQWYTLYVANNIKNQEDAQAFFDTTFGKWCKVIERWNSPNENEPNAFFIETNSNNENPFWDCSFPLTAKYRTFYSPRYQSMVFRSLTQEKQFYAEDGTDYGEIINFEFTKE